MKFIQGRYFCHHNEWEDQKHGMYGLNKVSDKGRINCVGMLTNQEYFWDTMCQMRNDWPNSFKVNVSNSTINRQAWLGQASCCYNFGCSFNEVIKYWGELNEDEKKRANKTAQDMIELFEREDLNVKKTARDRCANRCTRTIEMDF